MKNAEILTRGCANCGRTISREWSTSSALARTCENCWQVSVFAPENFEFNVTRTNDAGRYDFKGSRMMVNGRVGVLESIYGDWAFILFEGDNRAQTIRVGHWELKSLYERALTTAN